MPMRIAVLRLLLTAVAVLWVVSACWGVTQPRAIDPLTYDIDPIHQGQPLG